MFRLAFLRLSGEGILLVLFAAAFVSGWFLGWDSIRLQNVILLLAALAAILSLRSARQVARKKATLIFLHEYDNSATVKKGMEILNKRDDDHAPFSEEEAAAVLDFLNHMELLAIGLRNGIYDEEMVRNAMETVIVRYYSRTEYFIRGIRRKDGDVREVAYEHFESLAVRISTRLKNSK